MSINVHIVRKLLTEIPIVKMKTISKILIVFAIIILIPFIVGFFLPKERLVVRMTMIDQPYYVILGDITNHWEEPAWHHDIDTLIQKESVDGLDCWMEYYNNGDSVMLLNQKLSDKDYIRIIVSPDGREFNRNITLADVNEKTAIRISEEIYEGNPLNRFLNLFYDTRAIHIEKYLSELREKNKPATDEVPVE
jgi:hypothetical protein